jgi:CheY-like chemotaxis protein
MGSDGGARSSSSTTSPRTCGCSRPSSSGVVTILTATSGEEALDVVASARPDLTLLDALMPGIDGYAVCQALRDDEETRVLPVSCHREHRAGEDEGQGNRGGR